MIGINIEKDIKLSLHTRYLIICFENPEVFQRLSEWYKFSADLKNYKSAEFIYVNRDYISGLSIPSTIY